ncbi:YfiR family protein [Trichlorobacter lovleyi]|uniref:YfiR family protein n=1 Tax=Trichlorobacter lovleyi TaxID=313985 RepID=UPI002240A35A|nr:YfiR family protein [Trichlorobacter lovleyi]QOX78966.1 YfiR family protein [Trichlorobacter lovleyi]
MNVEHRFHSLVVPRMLVWVVLAGLLLPLTAGASDLETKIKTAYIYNFTKFIDWPADEGKSTSEPFRICLIGSDPIRTTLGELTNREAKGRPIRVVRIKEPSGLSSCHLLYISRSEETQLALILQRLQGTQVVTVSDIPQFAQRGGMISFVTDKERVRVQINQRTAREVGVKLSAKLLEIARVVQ